MLFTDYLKLKVKYYNKDMGMGFQCFYVTAVTSSMCMTHTYSTNRFWRATTVNDCHIGSTGCRCFDLNVNMGLLPYKGTQHMFFQDLIKIDILEV